MPSPRKKAKGSDAAAAAFAVLNPLPAAQIQKLREQYVAATPYAHAVIGNLCKREEAVAMLAEIQALSGTLKETDLFKVYQTGDLANADDNDPEHQAKLGTLLKLRKELNSPEFKKAIEEITGCGPLSGTVDLSANVYATGGHLLCHDDVISTRKVSYIVYLSDPNEPWTDEEGGRLELYASDGLVPDAEPSARVLPTFNSMAMFVVEPGVSFHSVEEVYGDRPRVSLQGWFHAEAPPEGAPQKASLAQLLASHPPVVFRPLPEDVHGPLSPGDLNELKSWVNPMFLTPGAMEQIVAKCETADACVSLVKFLRPDLSARLRAAMRASKANLWSVVGPAHMRRHMKLDKASDPWTSELQDLMNARMQSGAFLRFLERVTALRLRGVDSSVRRFRRGLDYTVATAADQAAGAGGALDVTLCFVEDDDVWATGDVGGFDLYLEREADDTGDVAAVYSRDQDGEGHVCIDAAFGTLAIVFRDASRMHFCKYLSRSAPSDRYDISMVFECAEPEGDEEEEEEEEDREADEAEQV